MAINLFAISGIVIGISSLFFGFLVFFKNPKSRLNQTWFLLAITVALWGLGSYKIGIAKDSSIALFWWRIAYIGVILMPTFLAWFVYVWLKIKRSSVIIISLIGVFFSVINLTDLLFKTPDLFIVNMKWVFNSFYYIAPPNPLYSLFVFLWLGAIIYIHYELFKIYKTSSGIKRSQVKYLLLAAGIGFSGGSTCFLPVYSINLYPIFNFTVPLYPFILSYSIIRHRFMDIRWVLGRSGVYVLSFTTTLLYGLLLFFLNQKLSIVSPFIFVIFLIATIIPLFLFLFRFFERVAGKYFYYTFYALQTTLTDLSKKLNQTIELDKLTNLINRSLLDALKLDKVGAVLKEPVKKNLVLQQLIKFNKEDISSLLTKEDNFLVQYLQKIQKSLVVEEIPFIIREAVKKKELPEEEKRKLNLLKEEMERTEIAVCLPLFIEKELIGIIILGDKLSGEAYTVQDLDLLTTLTAQAAIAFNNALSYEEIEKRKADLEKFYKLLVGRELKMIELKKKIKEGEEEIKGLEEKTKEEKS